MPASIHRGSGNVLARRYGATLAFGGAGMREAVVQCLPPAESAQARAWFLEGDR